MSRQAEVVALGRRPSAARQPGSRLRSAAIVGLTPVYRRAGSAYLVGTDLSTAMAIGRRVLAAGRELTVGYWPRKDEPPARVLGEYLATVDAVAACGPPTGSAALAVKAPSLGFDVAAALRLGRRAHAAGVGLLFDAHAPDQVEGTFALARAVRADGAAAGVALPARWARSLADVPAVAGAGLSVRLVKGQWPDDAGRGPAGEAGLRVAYLRLLDRLLEHGVPVAVATHDAVLLGEAVDHLAAAGVPATAELLLGLPVRRAMAVAVDRGAGIRFYLSFGHPGLPYPFTAVLRRPRLTAMLTQGMALGALNQRLQQRAALR